MVLDTTSISITPHTSLITWHLFGWKKTAKNALRHLLQRLMIKYNLL